MTSRKTCLRLAFFACLLCSFPALAQKAAFVSNKPVRSGSENYKLTPASMWELGLQVGLPLNFSDVDLAPGWGVGFHIRKAFDYGFSLRSEVTHAVFKNKDLDDGSVEAVLQSGSLQLLAALNNFSMNGNRRRKTNFYGLFGGGINRFQVKVIERFNQELQPVENSVQTHLDAGVGISFRLNERFNLGLETKAVMLFGNNADRLDGAKRGARDVANYSSLRFNYNLGDKAHRSEPLYWVNPIDAVIVYATEFKNRPVLDFSDGDGDGVIDYIDQEPNTPAGAPVDTRGILLDSDGDSIPNYLDEEPFISIKKSETENEEPFPTKNRDEKSVEDKLNEDPNAAFSELANWFLSMIHFDMDGWQIRHADFDNLASIGKMMKANPNLRLVVIGFTDKTASETYNLELSYKRAAAAIQHLVEAHGIERSRLILQYNGEDAPLVPDAGSNVMNRRVEFRVARKGDVEMEIPKKN